MALTVTFDELQLNAVRAALADKITKHARELANLKEQRDTPANAEAIDYNRAALRQAILADENIKEAILADENIKDLVYARTDEGDHFAYPVGA